MVSDEMYNTILDTTEETILGLATGTQFDQLSILHI